MCPNRLPIPNEKSSSEKFDCLLFLCMVVRTNLRDLESWFGFMRGRRHFAATCHIVALSPRRKWSKVPVVSQRGAGRGVKIFPRRIYFRPLGTLSKRNLTSPLILGERGLKQLDPTPTSVKGIIENYNSIGPFNSFGQFANSLPPEECIALSHFFMP